MPSYKELPEFKVITHALTRNPGSYQKGKNRYIDNPQPGDRKIIPDMCMCSYIIIHT